MQIGGWDSELTGMYVAKFEAGFPEGNNTTASVKSSQSYTQNISWVRKVEAGTTEDVVLGARNWLDGIYGETPTKISYPVFQPLTFSMNYISINDIFNISKAMNENGNIYGFTTSSSDTHLMKSSEWGMVSYLSYSQYGTSGQEITINNATLNSGGETRTVTTGKNGVDSVYGITGMTQGIMDGPETVVKIDEVKALQGNTPTPTGSMYAWNQKGGITASSTRNMTGIYDLSGGGAERTASYIANGNETLSKYGKDLTYDGDILRTTSTKYTMVYPYDNNIENNIEENTEENLKIASNANYAKNIKIYGDGIRETSTMGTEYTSWNNDYSIFPRLNGPFITRGGTVWETSLARRFCFAQFSGDSLFTTSFHCVVIPIK